MSVNYQPVYKIVPMLQSPDLVPACEDKQTCSECRGTPSCRWCLSPAIDLPARCNNVSVTEQLCPSGAVENTVSMDPVVIGKPYNIKEEYSTMFKILNPRYVRLEMNVGEEKHFNFTYMFYNHRVTFSNDLPDNMEMKIFQENREVQHTFDFGTLDFQVRLRLKSCPDNPLLWSVIIIN